MYQYPDGHKELYKETPVSNQKQSVKEMSDQKTTCSVAAVIDNTSDWPSSVNMAHLKRKRSELRTSEVAIVDNVKDWLPPIMAQKVQHVTEKEGLMVKTMNGTLYYSLECKLCGRHIERHFNMPKHMSKHLAKRKC